MNKSQLKQLIREEIEKKRLYEDLGTEPFRTFQGTTFQDAMNASYDEVISKGGLSFDPTAEDEKLIKKAMGDAFLLWSKIR